MNHDNMRWAWRYIK